MDGNQVFSIRAEVFENGFEADHFRSKDCVGLYPCSDVILMRDAECKELGFILFNTGGCVVCEKPWDAIGEGSCVACCLRIHATIAVAKADRVERGPGGVAVNIPVIRVVDEVKELVVQHVFGVAGGFCSPLCVDVESVVFPVGNSGAELPCVRKLCTQNDAGTASLLEEC